MEQEKNILRQCPECKAEELDEVTLKNGGIFKPAECPNCGMECARLNLFWWPIFPLLDGTILLLLFLFYGLVATGIGLGVIVIYLILVRTKKLNERFGPIVRAYGI